MSGIGIGIQSSNPTDNGKVRFSASGTSGTVSALTELTTVITEETPSGEQNTITEIISVEIVGAALTPPPLPP